MLLQKVARAGEYAALVNTGGGGWPSMHQRCLSSKHAGGSNEGLIDVVSSN